MLWKEMSVAKERRDGLRTESSRAGVRGEI